MRSAVNDEGSMDASYLKNCRNFTLESVPGVKKGSVPCIYNLKRKEITIDGVMIDSETGSKVWAAATFTQDSQSPHHQLIFEYALPHIQYFEELEFGDPQTPGPVLNAAPSQIEENPWRIPRPSTNGNGHSVIQEQPPPIHQATIAAQTLVAVQRQTLNLCLGLLEKHVPKEDGDWHVIKNSFDFTEEMFVNSQFVPPIQSK